MSSSLLDKVVAWNPVVLLLEKIIAKNGIVADIANYLKRLFCSNVSDNIAKYLFLIGTIAITFKMWKFTYRNIMNWSWLPKHLWNARNFTALKFREKYGHCRVLITGFTEGIGWAFAEVFADYGHNLLLISRNSQKVQRKVKQLSDRFPLIDIKYIVCDMSSQQQIKNLCKSLEELNADTNIGIVINNAGAVTGSQFLKLNPQNIISQVNVNLICPFNICQILLPNMKLRKEYSAILNISSCCGVFLSPRVGVYSMTKKALDVYSRILQAENDNSNIQVISVRPFGVTTKMMKNKKGPFMITPRQCVDATLADMLAGQKLTFTHAKHKMSEIAFKWLNETEGFQLYDQLWRKALTS